MSACLSGERLGDLGVVEPKRFRLALEGMRSGYLGPNKKIGLTALYLETWLALKMCAAGTDGAPVRANDAPAFMSVAKVDTASSPD